MIVDCRQHSLAAHLLIVELIILLTFLHQFEFLSSYRIDSNFSSVFIFPQLSLLLSFLVSKDEAFDAELVLGCVHLCLHPSL